MKIADLIDDIYLPQWEEYPGVGGFRVLLQLPDAARGFVLAARAYREAEASGEETPPETAIYLVRFAVADWQGLTVAGLRQLSGLAVRGEPAQEIPFSRDNLESLIRISGQFLAWVLARVQERLVAAKQEAELTANLSATPNTTPIPMP